MPLATLLAGLVSTPAFPASVAAAAGASRPITAWHDSRFNVDVAGVIGRSDIVLRAPNVHPEQAMPLGNGRLGLAVWSADGMTIQLNRADTLPDRLSPGQVVLPGLQRLVRAPDYSGRLDLYHGEFRERGDGMTARVYVEPDAGVAVVDVHGANPDAPQSALLHLWQPRRADVIAKDGIASLSATWKDGAGPGASGGTFGAMAAVTVDARNVRAEVEGPLAVRLSFRPKPDGSFRVLIAAPGWKGGDVLERARQMFAAAGDAEASRHRTWWARFWHRAGIMKLGSPHGAAQYLENLRAIDLYTAAAESRGRFPGSQAGVGDLFSAFGDSHKWDPAAYWHWNLRMQVAANLGAGLYRLNQPYFRLYRDNLRNIEAWTRTRMDGRPGACVPETMRFNGNGYEVEKWAKQAALDCSARSKPDWNARTLTTGAEISLWIWRQYLATGNRRFLADNFPVMAASTRFLLAYAKSGADGLLHTDPANAHETQWDVRDPTTDIAAMKALFPVVIAAAGVLDTDARLAARLRSALPKIPPFPLEKVHGQSVIGPSYDADAPIHNSENIGLEPVWPYGLIGEDGRLHGLGVHTYRERPFKFENDWSFDPIQAARLGLAAAVRSSLIALTEKYQAYPSGFAEFVGPEFYVEQIGVVAAALQQALVQDHGGIVRIAPAWPSDWKADATVHIRHGDKVDLQVRGGVPTTVVIEAGTDGPMAVRNPWPHQRVEIIASGTGRGVLPATRASVLRFQTRAGTSYVIQRVAQPNAASTFASINGVPASRPKSLGSRHLGIP